jgi:hypothetical protein
VTFSWRLLAAAFVIGIAVNAERRESIDLAIPDRTNGYPSIAAHEQFVAVAWGAATKDGPPDVYVASSADGGRTFRRPIRVNEAGSPAHLSGEQPPRVALVPRPRKHPSIVVTWTARSSGQTRLMFARSDEAGQSFGPAAIVPGTDAPGNRGWEATATASNGEVVAVWLDHRQLAGSTTSGGHAGHQHSGSPEQQRDGVARAQLSKLFFARLGRSNSVRTLTGGVCYCCKTSLAAGSNGAIYAAWRHVYPGNIRDIAFAQSSDGGDTFGAPVRVSEDQWVLDGCPENGPAMAVDGRGRIHIVWPTLIPNRQAGPDPEMALFYAFSDDGRRFTPRQPLPTEGFPGHAQIAVTANGELAVVWDEQTGQGRRIAVARGTAGAPGLMRFTRYPVASDLNGMYPGVATTRDRIIVASTVGAPGRTVVRLEPLPR